MEQWSKEKLLEFFILLCFAFRIIVVSFFIYISLGILLLPWR